MSGAGGEEDDPPHLGCHPLDDSRGSLRRGGPDEEDRTRATQCRVERLGHGEVACEDLDLRRQRHRRLGAMREGADRHAGVEKLVDDDAADSARRPGDEHGRDVWLIHAAMKTLLG